MTDKEELYEVRWGQAAQIRLAEMESYKVNPKLVFVKSNHLLGRSPRIVAYDVVDFENFKYNGCYWTLLNNVILVYSISERNKKVYVLASFFANTAWAHQIFWGIEPEDWEE
ncbi:hypothetical protein HUG15_13620 [Salicibibacter cibarius]|uniref:Uncharacterized protein n=1 Tax=Salicibibacter cibarius TaxID=2743000 RepID=A0A7T7CC27_9BACI|nr:hypothetical protein [Salicibibacter cibarius]QQK76503.1 hypothetical protein HUG15_13620 [Salicibibacter cibarius]